MALPKGGTVDASQAPGNAMSRKAGNAICWEQAKDAVSARPDGSLNIAYGALDRHAAGGRADHVALRWLSSGSDRREMSYGELGETASRAAAALRSLGVKPGDTVAVLMGRVPELFAVALGIWKAGAVFCPLFSAFGPGPLKARLELSRAKVLIAADSLYRRKVAASRPSLPDLTHVLLVAEDGREPAPCPGCSSLATHLRTADPALGETQPTRPEDPAFLHFTSGTTGTPKGVIHPHKAVLALMVTSRQVFELSCDDVFWCTAEPGWVTATAYGLIAPLVHGCTLLVDEHDVDPRRWYGILSDEKVTAWYTTPTAIRMMMRFGAALARTYRDTSSLRVAASVGEPLNAEAVLWGEKALGVPFLDTWWQTETGAITIANLPGEARRPGSMGHALSGVEAAVVRRQDGTIIPLSAPDESGELAIHTGWPSQFSAYVGDGGRAGDCIVDEWYLTGDLVRRDADGYFWFLGRADDMIKSGAQQIGPFEVESALMDHPAVAEIGVVGKPDLLLREVPVAFVSLNPGFDGGDALRAELLSFARQELGSAMAPREVHFLEAMPKTSSGKILRRVLKAKAIGEPEEAETFPLPPRVLAHADE